MNYYYKIIIIFFLTTTFSFSQLEILEPQANQSLCNDKEINFVLNQNSADYGIIAYIKSTQNYISLTNITHNENIISWYASDSILYNQAIDFKIYNKYNVEDFAILSNITIHKKIKIRNQTHSVLVCEGEEIHLSIETDDINNRFQWLFDGKIIPNANSPLFSIEKSLLNNSGAYSCIVSNESQCASVESAPIIVYVATPTRFLSRIRDFQYDQYEATRKKGMSIKLEAKVHLNDHPEANNIKFEWWKDTLGIKDLRPSNAGYVTTPGVTKRVRLQDGKKYSGTNTDMLTISDIKWSDRTNYYCIATGLCGSDISECYIGKNTLFTIQNSINEYEACDNQDVILEVYVEPNENANGKLFYNWYKTGTGLLSESEKYIGTDSPRLIIRKISSKQDVGLYFCVVSMPTENVSQFSDEILVNANSKPRIRVQPSAIAILDKTRKYYPQTFIDVFMENPAGCLYTWFRDGKIARKECWTSNYFLGIDSCPLYPAPTRYPEPIDVGWYRCRIRNGCGITWSDSVYISWGLEATRACENSDATLSVSQLGPEFIYEWKRNDKVISDNSKYLNSNTNKLTIKNVKMSDDGKYECNAIYTKDNSKVQFGILSLRVDIIPYVIKDFPYQIKNIGLNMPNTFFGVQFRGRKYYAQLFIDGKPETDLIEYNLDTDNYDDEVTTASFLVGGKNKNVKPGVYQYYFKADCGEVWSSKMIVINTEYVETGSIPNDGDNDYSDDLENISHIDLKDVVNDFVIFPNPSYNKLNIVISNSAAIITDDIQIYNSIGIEIKNFSINNYNHNNLEIDISKLNSGLYFIRLRDKIEKFIKLE